MGDQPTIDLRNVPFDQRARDDLSRIVTDDSGLVDFYAAEVDATHMQCVGLFLNDERFGTMICSWVTENDRLVFVCNALAADHVDHIETIGAVFDLCSAWAKDRGAVLLRFFTQRPGLVRASESLGFKQSYMMERAI